MLPWLARGYIQFKAFVYECFSIKVDYLESQQVAISNNFYSNETPTILHPVFPHTQTPQSFTLRTPKDWRINNGR